MAPHSVGLLLLYGALDSHAFVSSHVASGRCVLSAAAAGAPAGVVSAFAEPSSWCAGAVLVVPPCPHPPPPCDIPSGCCPFTGPWTVTRSALRGLRRVAVF